MPKAGLEPRRHADSKEVIDSARPHETLYPRIAENLGYKRDVVEGRWVIETRHGRKDWEVIVEPDNAQRLLVVVTAYPVEEIK